MGSLPLTGRRNLDGGYFETHSPDGRTRIQSPRRNAGLPELKKRWEVWLRGEHIATFFRRSWAREFMWEAKRS